LINSNVLHSSINEWMSRNKAEQVQSLLLQLRAAKGPTQWYLVKFPVQ